MDDSGRDERKEPKTDDPPAAEDNPAEERQEEKKRVEKPGPHTIDQSQEDVAEEEEPMDTPRGGG